MKVYVLIRPRRALKKIEHDILSYEGNGKLTDAMQKGLGRCAIKMKNWIWKLLFRSSSHKSSRATILVSMATIAQTFARSLSS